MAKFYVAYKKSKLDGISYRLYYVTKKVTLKDGFSNRAQSHLELSLQPEEAFKFESLQVANDFIALYNLKQQTWYLEEIDVRLRRSKSEIPAPEVTDNSEFRRAVIAIDHVIHHEDNLVEGEDGEVYVSVKLIDDILRGIQSNG